MGGLVLLSFGLGGDGDGDDAAEVEEVRLKRL